VVFLYACAVPTGALVGKEPFLIGRIVSAKQISVGYTSSATGGVSVSVKKSKKPFLVIS
jgi:hypothetical protein